MLQPLKERFRCDRFDIGGYVDPRGCEERLIMIRINDQAGVYLGKNRLPEQFERKRSPKLVLVQVPFFFTGESLSDVPLGLAENCINVECLVELVFYHDMRHLRSNLLEQLLLTPALACNICQLSMITTSPACQSTV